MMDNQSIPNRKTDHILINLNQDVSSSAKSGFDTIRFENEALPEFNLGEVDTRQTLFGKNLAIPLLISSMTGGAGEALNINRHLALAAQEKKIAMGVGSQRVMVEDQNNLEAFKIRKYAPNILLFANLGAIQLNYGYSVEDCQRAVDDIEADGLYLHLNPLQEALQPEGETQFSGLLDKIEGVCKKISVPVIIKEVGWGISGRTARRLVDAGVSAIDVAGAGGTSWSQVEMHRISDPHRQNVAAGFRNWGIPTCESIVSVKLRVPEVPIIASGGLRNGVDLAKSIALGAVLGGIARPFLQAATISMEETIKMIDEIDMGLRITMFASGARNLKELQMKKLLPNNY